MSNHIVTDPQKNKISSAKSEEPSNLPIIDVAEVLHLAQAASLGVPVEGIKEAELAEGKKYHPRVSSEQIDAISELYHNAQHRLALDVAERRKQAPVNVLCAPTARIVDLIIDERALGALSQKLIASGQGQLLSDAINSGPGVAGAIWEKPKEPIELVASILRWGILRGEEKKRLRVSDHLRKWVFDTLAENGISPLEKLGGAAAISAALAPVLGRTPTMMALGKLPPDLLHHLSSDVAVIGDDPNARVLGDLPLDQDSVGNFCLSFKGKTPEMPEQLKTFQVDGELRSSHEITWIEIFITGSAQVPGFNGLSTERLEQIGKTHELAVLTGMQYLTSVAEIEKYFDVVDLMHRAGTKISLLYSESKAPELESDKWLAMKRRRAVDFFGMNAAEAFDILERMLSVGKNGNPLKLSSNQLDRISTALRVGSLEGETWGSGKESPEWLFESARLLQEILEIPVLRVRAKALDVVVTSAELKKSSAEHTRDSIIVSRNMGTLKVANVSGVLDEIHELEMLKNSPHGLYLAALHVMADYAHQHNERAETLPTTCIMSLSDGRKLFAVPPIPFFSRRGSTQSAGDTIDFTFASEELDNSLRAARELLPTS